MATRVSGKTTPVTSDRASMRAKDAEVAVPVTITAAIAAHVAESNPHTQYLRDALSDGQEYVRKNGAWSVASAGSGGGGNLDDALALGVLL